MCHFSLLKHYAPIFERKSPYNCDHKNFDPFFCNSFEFWLVFVSQYYREMANEKEPKRSQNFECKICDYTTCKIGNWNRHISTHKHKRLIVANKKSQNIEEHNKSEFVCEYCGKMYKHLSSLCKHKKKCYDFSENNANDIIEIPEKEEEISKITVPEVENKVTVVNDILGIKQANYEETMNIMIQENKELRNILIEQQKQIGELIPKVGNNNTTNNTTHNTNNFNLSIFLNEQCKDAVNLIDFINSLQVEFSQMEYTGSHGFVEGMSNIFNKAIQNMEVTKRPIHCTDLKRDILYVKDNEVWGKDDDKIGKMATAIDIVKQNNLSKISEWVKENPGCEEMTNPKNDMFINMIKEHSSDNSKDFKKVIKSIAKSSMIPKHIKT